MCLYQVGLCVYYSESTSQLSALVGEGAREGRPGERAGLGDVEVVRLDEGKLRGGQAVDGHGVGERLLWLLSLRSAAR